MRRGVALLATLSLAACGLDAVGLFSAGIGDAPDASPTNDATTSTDGPPASGDATVNVADDAEAGPPPPPKPTIFLSATNALWKYDVASETFAKVGDFVGCSGGVEELAVDANGNVVGTRDDNGAYILFGGADKTTCSVTVTGVAMPFALTFAPKGTLQANADTLVGYNGNGDYVRYDRLLGVGTIVQAGALGDYRPRGDVTFGAGGKGYVAAVAANANVSCPTDCLVEVDLKTGFVTKKVTEFPSGAVYAIAFSDGKVHGFVDNAKLDIVTLEPLSTRTITPDAGIPGFRGAGASTAGL